MFKSLFSHKKTKADVIFAVAAAVAGVWKAFDTVKEYKAEQESSEKEKDK